MLTALFVLAAVVLIAGLVRRPRNVWERALIALAGILGLAVLVAWAIEALVRA